jgi:MFS family permease
VGVLAVSAHSASSVNISVLMKPMLADFGWSRSDFAWTMTIRLVALIAMMPLAGVLADRYGARVVLGAGAVTVGVGLVGVASIQSWGQLAALSAMMGPGQACIGSVAASALVLRLFRRQHGVAIGILNGGDNLINALVPLGAIALLQAHGWRTAVAAMAIAYVALAALIATVLRDEDGRVVPDPSAAPAAMPWRDPRLWVLVGSYAAIYAWITSIQIHFHAYQTDEGRTGEAASGILSLYLLVGAVGSPLFGWLAQRTSARFSLLLVTAGLTVSAATIWTLDSVAALRVWAVGHGLVNSGVVAVLALVLYELFGARSIGRLMGFAMVFCMSATLLGNQWSAWMFDRFGSYVPAWQAYAGLMVCTLVPVTWLWQRGDRPPPV